MWYNTRPMKDALSDRAVEINAHYAAKRSAESAPAAMAGKADTVRHVCARCGWEWRTYADATPRSCPSCRARKWQTPPTPRISDTVRKCLHCGHEWRARKSARPCACPVCASPNWDKPPKFRRGKTVQGVA